MRKANLLLVVQHKTFPASWRLHTIVNCYKNWCPSHWPLFSTNRMKFRHFHPKPPFRIDEGEKRRNWNAGELVTRLMVPVVTREITLLFTFVVYPQPTTLQFSPVFGVCCDRRIAINVFVIRNGSSTYGKQNTFKLRCIESEKSLHQKPLRSTRF